MPTRLLAARSGPQLPLEGYPGLERARAQGAFWLQDEITAAGLRGRGGAGFPTALKWRTVASSAGPHYVVANGEEGEPSGWKDRYLMRRHPHLVLEGIALAALAVDSDEAWLYLADESAAQTLRLAIEAAGGVLKGLTVHITVVPHTYVAGEESAAIRFIQGGPALPTSKPPRPFQSGVRGYPTVVDNVETLAHAAWIATHGAAAFSTVGTSAAPGTFLATVTGDVARRELLEIPFGVTIRTILDAADPTEPLAGALIGGYFGGYLPEELLDTPADDESLKPLGFGLGNGAFVAIGRTRCPVTILGDLASFFAASSAGQCGACAKGTVAMRDIFLSLRTRAVEASDLERLEGYGSSLRGRGACQLLDAAALVATRAFAHFRPAILEHSNGGCASCRRAGDADPGGGFAVDIEEVAG